MSAETARAFLPALRELGRGLAVPLPERVRILRELEYDLEALRDRLVAEGVPADEARTRALEALAPDSGVLAELSRVHASAYRRLTRYLDPARLRLLERAALAAATAGLLLAQTRVLLGADLLLEASPFLWPVLALGGVLFALIFAKAFELWVARDHGAPNRGLHAIVAVAGATVCAGGLGVLFDLSRLGSILEVSPDLAGALVPVWIVRNAALLSISILIALAGALAWLVFSQWVAWARGAYLNALGLPAGHSPPEDDR